MAVYDGWAYSQEITIKNNVDVDLSDFQVLITLDSTWGGWDKVKIDGGDIRFSTQDGSTALSYFIEEWDAANKKARIWVKVPTIPASGSTTILMWWGNSDATSESDGSAVFEFFDDFEAGSIDTNKWVVSGNVSVSDGQAILTAGSEGSSITSAKIITTKNIVLESRVLYTTFDKRLWVWLYHYKDSSQVDRTGIFLSGYSGWAREVKLSRYLNGTWAETRILSSSSTNTWYLWAITYYNSQVKGCVNSTCTGFLSQEDANGHKIAVSCDTNGQGDYSELHVDWVRVRKYAATEPSFTLGAITSRWLDGWAYRNKITISNPYSFDVNDYPVPISLDSTWEGWGHTKSDGADLRATASDGTTTLPIYVESFDETNKTAKIYVRVPTIPASGSVDIYLYYGNPDASSASDPTAKWFIYEDMQSAPSGTLIGNAYYDETNKRLVLTEAVRSQSGQLEYTDDFGSYYAEFTSYAGGGSGADAIWFYALAETTPDSEDASVNGFILADDEYSNDLQIRYNSDMDKIDTSEISGKTLHNKVKVIREDDGGYTLELSNELGTITRSWSYEPTGTKLGVGGRTGGSHNWHIIHELKVKKQLQTEPSITIGAQEAIEQTYTFYKRVKLVLQDDASNEDVELIIDDKFKAFWQYRGKTIGIAKDGDTTLLPLRINSETIDHISITVPGLTGQKGDVYWLYFDDGNDRDTSNLDDTFAPANLAKRFSIDYNLPAEPYVIYDVTFSGFAGRLTEDNLPDLTVVDGNTNTVVAHRVVDYTKDADGNIDTLRLQVKAAYATDTRVFYLYLAGQGTTFTTEDGAVYPIAASGWQLVWEEKGIESTGNIVLDGNTFNVREYEVGYKRNTFRFDIEEGESYNLPSSNYARTFRLKILAREGELATIQALMIRPFINVEWLGEEFHGQIVELRYSKKGTAPNTYEVEMTLQKVRVM